MTFSMPLSHAQTLPLLWIGYHNLCISLLRLISTVKHILRYLKGSSYFGPPLHPTTPGVPFSLRAYSDVGWAMDVNDHCSTSMSCIFFRPNIVSWSSKKQALVDRSNTEVEYRSMAHSTIELLWMQSLLRDYALLFTLIHFCVTIWV